VQKFPDRLGRVNHRCLVENLHKVASDTEAEGKGPENYRTIPRGIYAFILLLKENVP
jgi:hypothetical protein